MYIINEKIKNMNYFLVFFSIGYILMITTII